MCTPRNTSIGGLRILALFTVMTATLALSAQTENVVYRFKGATDGSSAFGGLTFHNGSFYGTTAFGGVFGQGTVFQLTPPTVSGAAWTKTILYNFTGLNDGASPQAGVTFDSTGNLYGTASGGGANVTEQGGGVVFELSPPASAGASWTESALHAFPDAGDDGFVPVGDLTFDSSGNLYGVTTSGGLNPGLTCGSQGCGTVFQLQPPAVAGGAWTENVIYRFLTSSSTDGFEPAAGVVVGPGGVLYGTTGLGGQPGVGMFFKLTPPAIAGGAWTEKILYVFQSGADGSFPNGLTLRGGVLYGTTGLGGSSNQGTVFALTPPTATSGWKKTIVYSFTGGLDGAAPFAPVVFDAAGNLYGTTNRGGVTTCRSGIGCGAVYELSPPTSGGAWTETTLHTFTGIPDGGAPYYGRLALVKGSLFGTTVIGGVNNGLGFGTIYRVKP